MKHSFTFFLALFLSVFISTAQQPGDEIEIQTIEFDGYPVGDGWLAPREGYFDFTEVDGLEFEKVYVKYRLKCDPTQNPNCGEWDYLSYLKIIEHTGVGLHPSYLIGGEGGFTPDTFSYMNDTAWEYVPRYEETIVYDNPNALTEYQVGNGSLSVDAPFNASLEDSHVQYLYRQSELSAAGLTAGDLTGMQFNVLDTGGEMQNVKISLKATTLNELDENVDLTGFTEVYSKNTTFSSTGWQHLDFTSFFNWDSTSNIIVDISFVGIEGEDAVLVSGSNYAWDCAAQASTTDSYFNFNGPDKIDVPTTNLGNIQDEITISFWVNGNEEQPQDDSVFDAIDVDGNRMINVHLPWSGGGVFWDAGDATGYDRINIALTEDQYKGVWNHWAFTKNAVTGVMNIYLNGELLHTGSGLTRPIGAISEFPLGKGQSTEDRFYDGKIDDFQVWSTELDEATIAAWMHKEVDASHPNYSDLKVNYTFDVSTPDFKTPEAISATNSPLTGVPQKQSYKGDHFKNFTTGSTRPDVKFNRNTSTYTVTQELVEDAYPKGKVMVETYVQNTAGEVPVLDETLYVNPTYYNNYQYDANLVATDSTLVTPDVTLTLQQYEYNTTEAGEEITVPWEIGRYLTPYGNGLDLGDDGWTWIFDVTDFQHLFQGDNVHIKAGNFQELLDMKFVFKVGTAPRDFVGIQSVYSGRYDMDTFDETVVNKTIDLDPTAQMFSVKTTLTGHDFGSGNNCGEFCYNTHKLLVNGTEEYSWEIMQECGENALYPQGGTWIYDRAGWCPGEPATVQNLDITSFINVGSDTTVDVDYDIDHDPDGNYVTEIFFVEYGAPNFTNDASLEEIIAPNIFKLNTRFNPICGEPIVKIKNTGEATLTSLDITYGVEGGSSYTYEWTGSLPFLEEEIVSLPAVAMQDYYDGVTDFTVTLSNANGQGDEYEFNNTLTSQFETAPIHEQQMIVEFTTNIRYYENNYVVYDTAGNIVFERDFDTASTTYTDLINLPPGCYELVVYDSGGDGMYNWPSNHGNGSIVLKNYDGTTITTLENWFGESIRYSFRNDAVLGTDDQAMQLYTLHPNPAKDAFTISVLNSTEAYSLKVYNVTGKLLHEEFVTDTTDHNVDISKLSTGVYLLHLDAENGSSQVQKLIVN
ncbi:hypothetical protein SCB49_05767 [unidentified eubacterium SCB49]|nr:hypothetical protein SCB49_05767 [unidentified eubacterium SCB49]